MVRSTGALSQTRRRLLPAKTRRRLSLRLGWLVSHPALAVGAAGRRVDQVWRTRRIPAAEARTGPSLLPRAQHNPNPGRLGSLGRVVRATGGHATLRHEQGSRAGMVRASRGKGLRG